MPKINFSAEQKGNKTQILGGHITGKLIFSTEKISLSLKQANKICNQRLIKRSIQNEEM